MITPSFSLDFTSAVLAPVITFTRALATATRVNSAGLIEVVAAGTARFNYSPVSLACQGLLVEEARTNKFTLITNFANSYFTKNRVAVSTGATASPFASINADKLTETATSGTHEVYREVTVTASTANTFSFYVKAAERTWVFANLVHPSVADNRTWFNLSTGVVGTNASGNTAAITNAGNGWWRITLSRTTGGTQTSMGCAIGLSTGNGTFTYVGDGTSGLFAYGLQHETGAGATSLITADGTNGNVTRNADVATITGTNFSDFWQATRGGASVLATPSTVSGIRPLVQFDDGTADNIIALRGNTTNPELYIVDGGAPQAQIDAGTIAANTAYSLTGWWQTNFCAARKDNGARVEDLTATIPTVTQARLGSDGTNYLNGHLATINYYDQFSGQIYTRRKNKAIFTVI
jgi:hypothetical protein